MGRIVQAKIEPIYAADLNLRSVFSGCDHRHPITKALQQQLPKLTLEALIEVRNLLRSRGAKSAEMSTQDDIESWIALTEREIQSRRTQSGVALEALLTTLGGVV